MTTQIEHRERAAIAQLVIDELRAEPQRLLPAELLRLPADVAALTQDVAALTQDVAALTQDVAALTQTVGVLAQTVGALVQTVDALSQTVATLEEGQRAIVAEQRAQGARLDALEAGQQAIIAEQRAIVAEQRAQGARLDALEAGQRVIVAEQQAIIAEQRVIIAEQRAQGARLDALEEGQRDMAARIKVIGDDLGTVKGWGLELFCARRPGVIANALNMNRLRTVDPGELAVMAAEAQENGTITRAQHDRIIQADVVYHGARRGDRTRCYTLLEVSYVVDISDVRRAVECADILSRITGEAAISAVAGDGITEGARAATVTATPGGVSDVDGVSYIRVQNGARLRS